MSLLIDVVKAAQGKPTDKVSDDIRNIRLAKCLNCPFMNKTTRSCGTFLMGGTVEYQGKQMELCGCNVDDKTKYKDDGCPLSKW